MATSSVSRSTDPPNSASVCFRLPLFEQCVKRIGSIEIVIPDVLDAFAISKLPEPFQLYRFGKQRLDDAEVLEDFQRA